MNLLKVLNYCQTPMGSRRLLQWIKQPLVKLPDIGALALLLLSQQQPILTLAGFCFPENRLNLVEALKADAGLRKDLQEKFLRRIPDLMRIVKKFHKRKAGLEDCVRVYEFMERLPELRDALSAYDGPHKRLIENYATELTVRALCAHASFRSRAGLELTASAAQHRARGRAVREPGGGQG